MSKNNLNNQASSGSKKSVWETVLRIIIAVASAIAGVIGGQAIG